MKLTAILLAVMFAAPAVVPAAPIKLHSAFKVSAKHHKVKKHKARKHYKTT